MVPASAVNFHEAMRVLCLEVGADRAQVRRAYLRAVKAHPPERDAEGFQRVRAAFELLQHGVPRGWDDDETEEPSPVESGVDSALVVPADPLEPYRMRLALAESDEARHDVGQEAARAVGSAAAYELWLDALDYEDEAGLVAVAREAMAHGHQGFIEVLRQRLPSALSQAELTAWRESESGQSDFPGLAAELLERGRQVEAAHCLVEGYERLAHDPLSPRPFHWGAVDAVLRLVQAKQGAQALRVLGAFMAATRPEDRGEPVRFAAARELVAVHAELDPELASDIAEALREGKPENADVGAVVCANRSSKHARQQAVLLRERAPILASFYAVKLESPESPGSAAVTPGSTPYRMNWWAVWAFLAVARLFFTHACDDRAPRHSSHDVPAAHGERTS